MLGKIQKVRKNTEIQEKSSEKLGKILVRPKKKKKKKGPHLNLGKKLGKILKIRKNTLENQEKYFGKLGKIL